MTNNNDLLAPQPAASTAQTHAEIETMLRAENIALSQELERLHAKIDADEMIVALKHRHAVELTLAHMREIVWFAGHSEGLPDLKEMKKMLGASVHFDPNWYLAQDAGLRSSGMDPYEHFLRAGNYEGRNPGPDFDTMAYYLANPDVAESSWPALLHYEVAGRAEGRLLKPA